MKFALISHILPPSPSGQAMVLYRLLSGLSPDSYCLISREDYGSDIKQGAGSVKLPARYYDLKWVFRLPEINFMKLSALTAPINALWGIYRRAKEIEKIIKEEKCRLLIACTGDLYDLPAAWLASRRSGVPLVPYMFDDYLYQWTGAQRFVSRRMEPLIMKHARGLIVPNEYLEKEYRQRYGIKSTVIHNPCVIPDLEELDNAERIFNDGDMNIVYTGSIYHAHYDAFRNLIKAIAGLESPNIKLHLYTAQPEAELMQNGISGAMVVYHPHIDQSEVSRVLRQADALFLPLAFNSPIPEVIKTSAPGKTGEYLSVGRPILVHAPKDSFVNWYFRENRCGLVVDRLDSRVLSERLAELLGNCEMRTELGRRAREMAERDFNIDRIVPEFKKLLGDYGNESG